MTYTSLLAIACGRPADGPLLSTAAFLAARFGARVEVVPAFADPAAALVGLGMSLATPVSMAMLEEIAAGERDVLEVVTRLTASAAEAVGIPCEPGDCGPRMEVARPDVRPWLAVARALPLADLVLFDADSARGDGAAASLFGDVLLVGRSPVLVASRSGRPEFARICVAWDGGLEAGRAVRAAEPLLRAADEVIVLQAPQGLSAQQRENPVARPDALAARLRCAGVRRVSVRRVEGEAEGPGLSAAATSAEAGLLVAGAYGHSRFRELILGGATRTFVSMSDDTALFLTH